MKWSGMKTIICDIDGTLLNYLHHEIPHPGHTKDHVALPGVIEKMRQWEVQGCRIIIITGRRESERERTNDDMAEEAKYVFTSATNLFKELMELEIELYSN